MSTTGCEHPDPKEISTEYVVMADMLGVAMEPRRNINLDKDSLLVAHSVASRSPIVFAIDDTLTAVSLADREPRTEIMFIFRAPH
jgi:hypothetical protein